MEKTTLDLDLRSQCVIIELTDKFIHQLQKQTVQRSLLKIRLSCCVKDKSRQATFGTASTDSRNTLCK